MIWKGLGIITNSESPIVVVLRFVLLLPKYSFPPSQKPLSFSGSMEPAFYRGDLLFLTNPVSEQYKTGDITVYKIPGADIPIVHRVLETHDVPPKSRKAKEAGEPDSQLMLTKGDNNYVDDLELYQGLQWIERKHIVGKVRG